MRSFALSQTSSAAADGRVIAPNSICVSEERISESIERAGIFWKHVTEIALFQWNNVWCNHYNDLSLRTGGYGPAEEVAENGNIRKEGYTGLVPIILRRDQPPNDKRRVVRHAHQTLDLTVIHNRSKKHLSHPGDLRTGELIDGAHDRFRLHRDFFTVVADSWTQVKNDSDRKV